MGVYSFDVKWDQFLQVFFGEKRWNSTKKLIADTYISKAKSLITETKGFVASAFSASFAPALVA